MQTKDRARVKKFGPFARGERINSACIEHGKRKPKDKETTRTQILGLRLFTNRGRALIARALQSKPGEKDSVFRDGIEYESVKVSYLDMPFNSGSIIGFFGKSDDTDGKIYRLGIIWCKMSEMKAEDAEVPFSSTGDTVDSEDFALLEKDQTAGTKSLQDKLTAAQKVSLAVKFCTQLVLISLGT